MPALKAFLDLIFEGDIPKFLSSSSDNSYSSLHTGQRRRIRRCAIIASKLEETKKANEISQGKLDETKRKNAIAEQEAERKLNKENRISANQSKINDSLIKRREMEAEASLIKEKRLLQNSKNRKKRIEELLKVSDMRYEHIEDYYKAKRYRKSCPSVLLIFIKTFFIFNHASIISVKKIEFISVI